LEKERKPDLGGGVRELKVSAVIRETLDSCSVVFEIPKQLQSEFRYRAGQFLTLRIPFGGKQLSRSYSLASSPDCDAEHKITVKRVADGRISNWINDNVATGDVLQCLPPGGLFTLNDDGNDLAMFAAGSGITPVISILKSALATTERRVRVVYANRDRGSVIFREELDRLASKYGPRLELVYRHDDPDGFVDVVQVRQWSADRRSAEYYVCGPAAFMSTVERGLLEEGIEERRIHIERFVSPPDPDDRSTSTSDAGVDGATTPSVITVHLDGVAHSVPYGEGQTVLVACQTAGLRPPFSCTEAFCGCCMAKLTSGRVHMRNNDFLSKKEIAQGWVLTCQSIPLTEDVEIRYPD